MNARVRPVIVHVLPWQLCIGGAQRFIAELAAWARDWAEVHVIHLARGSDRVWAAAFERCQLHPVNELRECERLIRQLDPDLIHHHHPADGWGLGSLNGSYPHIGTPHDWPANLNPVDWAVPICGPNALIPHGVDLDRYHPPAGPQSHVPPFDVGIVGRIRLDRIPQDFVAALAQWRPEARGVRIHCYGRGLVDLVSNRLDAALRQIPGVILHGDVPPERMPDVYRQLDALLVPTVRESVGLAVLEAMASGLPVVARHVEGLPHTLSGGGGICCQDDAELLRAVERLRDNPSLREEMGRQGRAAAERRFDRRAMLDGYARIYGRCTGDLVRPPAGNLDCSVVMPVTDGVEPEWLHRAVMSVREQAGVAAELLIVADGITNQRLQNAVTVETHQVERVRVIRFEARVGIAAALNRGIREARADLIARADGDDVMPPGRLASQVAKLREDTTLAVISGDMARIGPDGNVTPMPVRNYQPHRPLWEYWRGEWPIAHPTTMFRRYPILRLGGYDETLRIAEDLDLWCRVEAGGYRIKKCNAIWNHYRIHPAQVTAQHQACREATDRILARYQQGGRA